MILGIVGKALVKNGVYGGVPDDLILHTCSSILGVMALKNLIEKDKIENEVFLY